MAHAEADPVQSVPVTPTEEPVVEVADDTKARSSDLAWTTVALTESLVLVGGLYWIMAGDGSTSLALRVFIVALVSVVSATAAALFIGNRFRSGS